MINKAKLSLFFLVAASAYANAQHPLERQLAQLKPIAVVPLERLGWPAGTFLCPLTPYQSTLPGASTTAQRVNAFLGEKRFHGGEGHWSLVVVKPEEIEQLVFKRDKYDVITSSAQLRAAAESVPAAFTVKECVEVQEAHVLVTRAGASQRKLISFGMAK